MEFQDPSWHVDETFAALAGVGRRAVRDRARPRTRRRRPSAGPARSSTSGCGDTTTPRRSSAAWAARLEPFLAAGDDVFVFFRHDEVGRGAELALALAAAIESRDGVVAESKRAEEDRSR